MKIAKTICLIRPVNIYTALVYIADKVILVINAFEFYWQRGYFGGLLDQGCMKLCKIIRQ